MDLQEVDDFIALAEARSFSKAADVRFVSQSAFSRRIKNLEEALGVSLINRNATPVALTKAGESFLRHALDMRAVMARAREEILARATDMPGALQIAMSASLASGFFPNWYRAVQRKIPDLNFHLMQYRSAAIIEELHKGTLDLAIILDVDKCHRNFSPKDMKSLCIGEDRLLYVRAPFLQDEKKFIAHRKGSYFNECAEAMLGHRRLSRMTTVFEAPSSEISRSMAMAGFGAAILQESLVDNDLSDGYLQPADVKVAPLDCKIMLLRSARHQDRFFEKVWKTCQG